MTILLLTLLGCPSAETECDETKACPLGSMCVGGKCEAQSCATSDQCGIEQYCKDRTCTKGCESDADCKFGDVCDTKTSTCSTATCTDTRVDCGFGQFCAANGTCFDAAGYYCRACNDDAECGGNGNLCYGGYCGVTCTSDADCPGGYDCMPFTDWAGNVVSHQCWTYCSLYQE